ncbi:MAG TPA: GGDEF domain-containing protein [Candidatus Saccharimonadales bacterium]|nr:GGDEF domain-containing protein [Candidatus Saccharimonadales bacterium]
MFPERPLGSEHHRRLTVVSDIEQMQPTAAEPFLLDKDPWHRSVDRAVNQARRNGSPLSVIFIDVNHFKDINDTLGHAEGDEVIAKLREMLVAGLRTHASEKRPQDDLDLVSVTRTQKPELPYDLTKDFSPGHIGGDEFGVLCKADGKEAQVLVDRLRTTFDEFMSAPENEELSKLGISLAIGVSALEPGWDSAQLLSEADWEMYRDKERQLGPLNDEQKRFLKKVAEGLEKYKIRTRDVGKYLVMLSSESDN